MNFFAAMLSEDGTPQNTSTMRVCSLLIVVVVLGVWAVVSVEQMQLQALSTDQTALVLGALGIKAWQRGKEGTGVPATISGGTAINP